MGSEQSNEFTKLLASVQERSANPNLDLPATRDICEALASATKEPEGVTYVEVYAGGVPARLRQRLRAAALSCGWYSCILQE